MEKKKKLVMIGAGGHAKVCYDIAELIGDWEEIIVLDDNPDNEYFNISGSIDDVNNFAKDSEFFIGIGNNEIRESITNKLLNQEYQLVSLIHPQAIVAKDVKIGIGTVIMAGAVINSASVIGIGSIINTSASIDHDNIIGDFVHVSPGVHLAGSVTIGNKSWIGMGTNIINNINIGTGITIGAGSLVLKNLESNNVYYGVLKK